MGIMNTGMKLTEQCLKQEMEGFGGQELKKNSSLGYWSAKLFSTGFDAPTRLGFTRYMQGGIMGMVPFIGIDMLAGQQSST